MSFLLLPWAACALLLWVNRADVCVRACMFQSVSLLNATRPQLVENAWNFPYWLYFSFLQCSGLTQYILVVTVGVPRMHVFQVSKYRIYIYWFLFQLKQCFLQHEVKGCVPCIQVLL